MNRPWLSILCLLFVFAFLNCNKDKDIASKRHAVIQPAKTLPLSTPWNLEALSKAPQVRWLDRQSPIKSFVYEGEIFQNKPTEVFAYYATPGSMASDTLNEKMYPGVILVHGGGGHAFKEWVELWAKRGYAALAMDLAGCGENEERLERGGPNQSDDVKFGNIDSALTEQWPYHAVANVIRAHSLLRSFKEVDPDNIAITGISWGGYLTSIVAGLDNRFKAAVPVYGCGFLHENSYWLRRFAKMKPEQRQKWVALFDPSQYIGSAALPIFFVNGTNDFAYFLDSYAKTYDLVTSPRNYKITVNMPHGHRAGWKPKEIGLFVDEYLRDGTALPKIKKPGIENNEIRADVVTKTQLIASELHYTTGIDSISKREWITKKAVIEKNRILAQKPPPETTIWFLTVTDERDATVSSEIVFEKVNLTLK